MKKRSSVHDILVATIFGSLLSCSEEKNRSTKDAYTLSGKSSQSADQASARESVVFDATFDGSFVVWGIESQTVAKGLIPFRFLEFPDRRGHSGQLKLKFEYLIADSIGTLNGTLILENKNGTEFTNSASRSFLKMAFIPLESLQQDEVGTLRRQTFGLLREEGSTEPLLEFKLVAYYGNDISDFDKTLVVSTAVPGWDWRQQLVSQQVIEEGPVD